MLWLALKPSQHRHMVVSFVMTGAIWLMLICSAGSRGVRFEPQNVEMRCTTPSVKPMLALRTMSTFAAKMPSLFCGRIAGLARDAPHSRFYAWPGPGRRRYRKVKRRWLLRETMADV